MDKNLVIGEVQKAKGEKQRMPRNGWKEVEKNQNDKMLKWKQ